MARTTTARTLLAATLLLAGGLAGCIGADDGDAALDAAGAPATPGPAGPSQPATLDGGLQPGDVVSRPDWNVGQWFGYHVFFGEDDAEGIHYDAVVVEDLGDAWLVGTADRELSKFEVMFDLPVLGPMAKRDLETTNEGERFSWYHFPLLDGATWSESYPIVQGDGIAGTMEAHFVATYDPAIETADGVFPGFGIVATTAEGRTLAEYDYVPAIGWFAHLYFYDPTSDDDAWTLHLTTMGSGEAYQGTAYVDEARELVVHSNDLALDPEGLALSLAPSAAFTVSEEATHVVGYWWSYADTGAHETVLVDAEREVHEAQAIAAPMAFSLSHSFWIGEAIAGDWHVATAGAGLAAGGGAVLWETVERPYTFPA